MKSVFFGETLFSKEMLLTLLENGFDVRAVISCPKKQIDDCENLNFTDLPYKQIEDINQEAEWIKQFEPEVIYCLGFRQILKKEILDICPVIGYHPTPLPKMRGHHPIIWALILKLKKTASTFYLMDEGIDSGDILSQEEVEIQEGDTVKSLYERIIAAAKIQILNLDLNKKTSQNHTQATYLRKRI